MRTEDQLRPAGHRQPRAGEVLLGLGGPLHGDGNLPRQDRGHGRPRCAPDHLCLDIINVLQRSQKETKEEVIQEQ